MRKSAESTRPTSFKENIFFNLLLLIIFVVQFPALTKAQDSTMQVIPLTMLEQNLNSLENGSILQTPVLDDIDTVIQIKKQKLLPDNISFAENTLWGENGLFRKIGLVSPLTRDERKYELGIRRTMLTAHQIGGFATLALMMTSAYIGQKVIDGHRNLGDLHQQFVDATIATYTLTGLLAVLSPPPLIRRDEVSTTSIHKTLAWVHLAGMIITPILGSMITGHHQFHIDKAHYHQVAGYLTTAAFAASLIVITF